MNFNPIKFSIVLIIIFILRFNDLITFMFIDFGLPVLRFQELLFFLIPGFYIISQNLSSKIRLKGLPSVILFFLTFLFIEEFYHQYDNSDVWTDIPLKILYIILSFYFLINTGPKYVRFTLNTFVVISILNVIIYYLNLIGVFSFIEFIAIEAEGGRVLSNLNINTINDRNVIVLLIAIFFRKYDLTSISFLGLKIFVSPIPIKIPILSVK